MSFDWKANPVINQGEGNYCWAACLAWWLKAVRKYTKYDMEEIIYRYSDYTTGSSDGDFMSLNEKGMYKLLNDPAWHLSYHQQEQSGVTVEKFESILKNRGPFLIGYTENNIGTDADGNPLTGFHMNVVIQREGFDGEFLVMDPNWHVFDIRKPVYYRQGTADVLMAYSTKLGPGATYGYDWDYV